MAALTIKQETFCQKYLETGNASEAYRQAYDTGNMKPETVGKRAAEMFAHGGITGRIAELQERVSKTHNVTVASLIAELEEARQVGKNKEQAAAMVSATLGKAKLAGLDGEASSGSNDMANVLHDLIAKLPG